MFSLFFIIFYPVSFFYSFLISIFFFFFISFLFFFCFLFLYCFLLTWLLSYILYLSPFYSSVLFCSLFLILYPESLFIFSYLIYGRHFYAKCENKFRFPCVLCKIYQLLSTFGIQHEKQGISKAGEGGGRHVPCPPPHAKLLDCMHCVEVYMGRYEFCAASSFCVLVKD